jgi:hypothetical protein
VVDLDVDMKIILWHIHSKQELSQQPAFSVQSVQIVVHLTMEYVMQSLNNNYTDTE